MEMLYQYLWKNRLFGRKFRSVDGEDLDILYPGVHNRAAGPDFSGARIRIAGNEWAGNVEIHVRASDWYQHNHHSDPAYDSVILHVVGVNDRRVSRLNGDVIPQMVLSFPQSFFTMYASLSERIGDLPCHAHLSLLPPLLLADWTSSLAVERLQAKAQRIINDVRNLNGDLEQACFIALARALGFSLNAEPFEMMARSIPLKFLARHSDNRFQLEALLLGQAGLLDTASPNVDDYTYELCREYLFLARKYNLRPLARDVWKRTVRPQNSPLRRIALLAASLEDGFSLLSQLLEARSNDELRQTLLQWEVSTYWRSHYSLGVEGKDLAPSLSATSIDLLLINFVAPMLYAHAAMIGDCDTGDRALGIWESLRPERNTYITRWQKAGISCHSAADSQGVLQLQREYCDRNRCLECRIGHALLRREVTPFNALTHAPTGV